MATLATPFPEPPERARHRASPAEPSFWWMAWHGGLWIFCGLAAGLAALAVLAL